MTDTIFKWDRKYFSVFKDTQLFLTDIIKPNRLDRLPSGRMKDTFQIIQIPWQSTYASIKRITYLSNFKFLKYDATPSAFNVFIGQNRFLDNVVDKNKIQRVFTVFGPSYWRPKVPHLCGYAKPQYIFKNSPFFFNQRNVDRIKMLLKDKAKTLIQQTIP